MNRILRLARYVMQGRTQAICVGLICSVLPLFGWVADVIVGLVTLRKGTKEGLLVLLWVMLPSVILAVTLNPTLWLYSVAGHHVLGFSLALLLRYSASWSQVLEGLLVTGLAATLAVHLAVPDISAFWLKQLEASLALIQSQFHFSLPKTDTAFFARMATGIQIVLLSLGVLFNLLLARALQAALYNPGQFRPELESIRLGKPAAALGFALVAASLLGLHLALDALPVAALVCGLAGLSVWHVFTRKKQFSRASLILFYGLLSLFFPWLIWLLVVLAWVDSAWDLRRRWQLQPSPLKR